VSDAPARVTWHSIPIALPEPGGSRAFELASRKLLLCNAGGAPYVIENVCPHVRVSMEGGAIDGTVLECPHHGGRLDLRDGRPLRMPIRQRVATFAVRASAAGDLEVAMPESARVPWDSLPSGG
jgi:3-phenylpropionate/trans-cinnamate dioxygenase ferredoxin subunit